MASLKSLFKDTAIYGLSSIVGRFLNYLLVPMYTNVISVSSGGYGIITNIYAYVALLFVVLTYGMETTFFRFINKEPQSLPGQSDSDAKRCTYSTIMTMIASTSLLFVLFVLLFLAPISGWMGYEEHPSYVWTMAVVVAIDAFQAIPYAYLRYKKKAIKFAALKLINIIMNIGLNLLFFLVLYNPEIGAGYAFYINLFCTAFMTLFFFKELREWRPSLFSFPLMKQMLSYSWPILILGIAGILNQTADKMLFPKIYPSDDADTQLGIYGAATKIAMVMAMITQAFRYAYEPFVFGTAKEKDQKKTYSKTMEYFLMFTLLAFLMVVGYMDILKYLIGRDYWEGLRVVPIVMVAEIMMGVYFNLSFWYKLTDKTIWGAVFSGIGCAVLLLVNILFVPEYGYMACAWGGVAGYATAMVLSYIVGQREYPIDYHLPRLFAYILLTALAYLAIIYSNKTLTIFPALLLNTAAIALFALAALKISRRTGRY